MITDDFINPEHQGADRELLRTFYEACHADGGTADEITLRGIRAVLAFAAADRPAAVAQATPAAGQRQALSPTVQAIMAAIQGETSPQIIVAQAYRALAFLRLAEPSACELLVDVAQELDP